jgi:hypothetical protein
MKAQRYIGKHLLFGIAFRDRFGDVLETVQAFGTILDMDTKTGIVIEKPGGKKRVRLPPGEHWLRPAPPVRYWLPSSREVVVSPDYMASCDIDNASPEIVRRFKVLGFGAFNRAH